MRRAIRTLAITAFALALAVPFGGAPFVGAAGELDIFICAGPYALVDANKPGEEGPMVLTFCVSVTNTSGSTCDNIDVYIGDGATPGTFALGTDASTSLSLPGCVEDAHRFIPSLADGETKVLMWQLTYPPTFDVTYDLTVWAESQDGTCDGTDIHQITTRSSITAQANKILGNVTVDPPSGVVSAGNVIEVTITDFDFGVVGDGFNGEQDAWLQPLGNLDFDPCCFRLVSIEVMIASIDGTPEPPYFTMPYLNRLYFPGIKSQDLGSPPDYAQDPGDYVIYRFIALDECTTVIQPYQNVASGQEKKYSGDYGEDDATITLTSEGSSVELEKSVSPTSGDIGDTLTWTIDYLNTTALPIGDPSSGAALVIIEQGIPDGTQYVAGSAACAIYNCIIFFSTDGGATWDTTEPTPASDVEMIKWYITEVVPSSSGGSVSFDTEVTEALSPICNTATAQIGDGEVIAATTVCANVPPDVEASKVDALLTDNDSDGAVSPGDVLRYNVVIAAQGDADAEAVLYNDALDPNVTLDVGTVATTQGTVTNGNTAGDTGVSVDVGTIPAGNSVTITYDVIVDDPLPEGVTHISNQGIVRGDNFPAEPTDDPSTDPEDDPTVVQVVSAPDIEVLKTAMLHDDADSNGVPSPGDVLAYTVVTTNNGNQDAADVELSDAAPTYTSLVVGSVTTTQGTVLQGNTAGDTLVEVAIGTLAGGGGSATVEFLVAIDNVVPVDVDTVANQAFVAGGNFSPVPSDDPGTPPPGDPTETHITAAPDLEVYKRACHCNDADGNGFPSPGDNLTYTITILNDGNQEARDVVFADTPDPNTTLVIPTVSSSQGSIIVGNTAGDSSIVIDIGTVAPGGQVEISFTVLIENGAFSQVANQGTATGSNFDDEPSDDPGTPANDDPTVTPVLMDGGTPLIEAYKMDLMVVDADGSGNLSAGDTLEYIVTIHNGGTAAAEAVSFTDTPGANTSLVVGSVSTSQGSVVQGNTAGDTSVEVSIGDIEVGVTVTIELRVVLGEGDYTAVSNQGLVEWGAAAPSSEPTDDPDTDTGDDPTESPVYEKETPAPPTMPRAVGGEAMRPDKLSIVGGLVLLFGALTAAPFVVRRALSMR